jgi:tetratricopeptide (TPR) repeat protein
MAATEVEDLLVDALHMQANVVGGVEAAAINERALKIVRSSVNPATTSWEASLLNNLGWAYHDLGFYEEALRVFEEAIPIREKMGENEPYLAARWCWARCLRSLGRYQEALDEQTELKKLNPSDEYIDEEIEALTEAMK